MRNKTQHEKAGSSSSDAREERSRKADVGEAAEQTSQGSASGKPSPTKGAGKPEPSAPVKEGNNSGSSGK